MLLKLILFITSFLFFCSCGLTLSQKRFTSDAEPQRRWAVAAAPRTIFVSSSTSSGNMGSVSNADSRCQALASSAGLPGSFIALISTGSVNAKDRIGQSGPLSNTKGELVANDANDLFDGSLIRPIQYDEKGNAVGSPYVWTGSSALGQVVRSKVDNSVATCSNWGFGSGEYYAAVGLSDRATSNWLHYDNDYRCSTNQFRIYCVTEVRNSLPPAASNVCPATGFGDGGKIRSGDLAGFEAAGVVATVSGGEVILMGPTGTHLGFAKMTCNGRLNPSFGTAGVLDSGLGAQHTGSMIGLDLSTLRNLVGTDTSGRLYALDRSQARVRRFTPSGQLDVTFNGGEVNAPLTFPKLGYNYYLKYITNDALLVRSNGNIKIYGRLTGDYAGMQRYTAEFSGGGALLEVQTAPVEYPLYGDPGGGIIPLESSRGVPHLLGTGLFGYPRDGLYSYRDIGIAVAPGLFTNSLVSLSKEKIGIKNELFLSDAVKISDGSIFVVGERYTISTDRTYASNVLSSFLPDLSGEDFKPHRVGLGDIVLPGDEFVGEKYKKIAETLDRNLLILSMGPNPKWTSEELVYFELRNRNGYFLSKHLTGLGSLQSMYPLHLSVQPTGSVLLVYYGVSSGYWIARLSLTGELLP